MEAFIEGMNIFYKRYDGNGTTVLLMHGWGADSSTMDILFNYFKNSNISVISLDFFGFGKSSEPNEGFEIFDYARTVSLFLKQIGIKEVIAIGHSFGGRVAVILSAEYKIVKKLILIDSAGCKPHRGIKYRLRVLLYKIKKRLKLLKGNEGSADYKALNDNMKKVFVRVVNTYLESQMKKIDIPTLLIWGKNDLDTPLYMAKRMNKLIKDSGLIVLENAGHFSYIDRAKDVTTICGAFVNAE